MSENQSYYSLGLYVPCLPYLHNNNITFPCRQLAHPITAGCVICVLIFGAGCRFLSITTLCVTIDTAEWGSVLIRVSVRPHSTS